MLLVRLSRQRLKLYFDTRLCSEQLDSTRDTSLEESFRIVLLANSLHLRFACRTVRADYVLKHRGVIEILEPVEESGCFCRLIDFVD